MAECEGTSLPHYRNTSGFISYLQNMAGETVSGDKDLKANESAGEADVDGKAGVDGNYLTSRWPHRRNF